MAFSKLAQTYAALGYDDKAEQASRRAVELSDNLPAQDRFLIQASHASMTHDTGKAIAAYRGVAEGQSRRHRRAVRPGQALRRQPTIMIEAKRYLAKLLASDPKNVAALLASGRVDIKANDPQAALDPLNKALSLAIQFDNQEQKGDILQALGSCVSAT